MTVVNGSTSSDVTVKPVAVINVAEANAQLATASPQEILAWAMDHFPDLYQTTAFGLTGVATIDMISKLSKKRAHKQKHLVPLIFLDTLYHFQETLDLAERIRTKYKPTMYVYKPLDADTLLEFEQKYGRDLWQTDEDTYDYVVKAEPARRAYTEHHVKAVITGRRQSQGAERANLEPIEQDSTGLYKVNPLCRWGFNEVKDYVDMAGVPYNTLLDKGFKSIGDWHSTKAPSEGESERDGRWAGNKEKTECGLHKDYFRMKKAFDVKKEWEAKKSAADKSKGESNVGETSVDLSLLAL